MFERVERGFQHGERRFVHLLQLQLLKEHAVGGFELRAQHKARDAVGIVADALQVVVDFEHGQGEAQVDGHGVVQGDEVCDVAVYFQLEGVDAFLAGCHLFGQRDVGVEHRFVGVVELLVNEHPHIADFLADVLQFVFYKLYHDGSSCERVAVGVNVYPKRPVM